MIEKNQFVKVVFGVLLTLSASIPLSVWGQARLESPADGGVASGIGVIRGWRCEPPANGLIQIVIDGDKTLDAPYGSGRKDTEEVCGDRDNGWGATFNFSNLSAGIHTITASADGEQFGSATFTVGKPSEENYLRGAPLTYHYLADFPEENIATVVQWQENQQNFMIVDSVSGAVPQGGTWRNSGDDFEICWHVADDGTRLTNNGSGCGPLVALRIQGEGRDSNGQPCVIDVQEGEDVLIRDGGVIVHTFYAQNSPEEPLSSTYAVFINETEASGNSIAITPGSDCEVDFNIKLEQ